MIQRVADFIWLNLPQVVADLGHHFPLLPRPADLDAHLQDFGTSTIFGVDVLKLVPGVLRHAEVQGAHGGVEALQVAG